MSWCNTHELVHGIPGTNGFSASQIQAHVCWVLAQVDRANVLCCRVGMLGNISNKELEVIRYLATHAARHAARTALSVCLRLVRMDRHGKPTGLRLPVW